jgi:hypothetical protein
VDGKILAEKVEKVVYAEEKANIQSSVIVGGKICNSQIFQSTVLGQCSLNSSTIQQSFVGGECEINHSTISSSDITKKVKVLWSDLCNIKAKDAVSFKYCNIYCNSMFMIWDLVFQDFQRHVFEGEDEYLDVGVRSRMGEKIGWLEQKEKEDRALFVSDHEGKLKLLTDSYHFLVDGKPFDVTLDDLYSSYESMYLEINSWFTHTQTQSGTDPNEIIRSNNMGLYATKLDLCKCQLIKKDGKIFARKTDIDNNSTQPNETVLTQFVLAKVPPITLETLLSTTNVLQCYNKKGKNSYLSCLFNQSGHTVSYVGKTEAPNIKNANIVKFPNKDKSKDKKSFGE